MIRQDEKWKAFVVKNQAHYNKTNESKFNLIALTPEERGWTELFQIYPPKTNTGGSGTSPINGRSYSWTYGFLPVGYFGVKNQSRVFTSSGTWTCPADVKEIYVRCIAAGGAGSNGKSGGSYKGGGGGGGFIMAKISTTPGNNYAVSISSGLTSFGGVMTATAGNSGANGGTGGNFTHTETPTILFTGAGGDGGTGEYGGGGGGGGSELGKGGNGGTGGGSLHSFGASLGSGGGGMLGLPSSAGAGFKSPGSDSTGGGMFSRSGIKKTSSPYYDKLSAEITENLGAWGSPRNYGGGGAKVMFSGAPAGNRGKNATANSNATAGGNAGFGGFGGGGGAGGRGGEGNIFSTGSKPAGNGGKGGAGGYGGGGGCGGGGGNGTNNDAGAGNAGGLGGAGGGGGAGGDAGVGGRGSGGNGAAGGYGGGGGGGGSGSGRGGSIAGAGGSGAAGGAGLVIIEW